MKNSIRLLHMYPGLLDLYGDSGNVQALRYRCAARDIKLEVFTHELGDEKRADIADMDIIYLGGGADYEQQQLAEDLISYKKELSAAHKNGTFMLMICGGYQLMGKYYKDSNDKKIDGLGLFEYYTEASTDKRDRCIGNIVVEAELDGKKYKVIGFENHGGQTFGSDKPFGRTLCGNGNVRGGEYEGYMEERVIATYLHGPLLSKNPLLTDYIISKCTGIEQLKKLDDSLEERCRDILLKRLLK